MSRRRWVSTGDGAVDALGDARRNQIISETWRLIATVGLEQSSMRRIAEEVGCTTGLVTHYFANKNELLLAALQRISDQAAARMQLAADARGVDRLRSLASAVLPLDEERQLEWRVWLAFWGRAYPDATLAAEQHSRYRRWRSAIRLGMEDAIELGELRPDVDAVAESTQFVSLMMGLSIDAINRRATDEAHLLDAVEYYLRRIVAPEPGASSRATRSGRR